MAATDLRVDVPGVWFRVGLKVYWFKPARL